MGLYKRRCLKNQCQKMPKAKMTKSRPQGSRATFTATCQKPPFPPPEKKQQVPLSDFIPRGSSMNHISASSPRRRFSFPNACIVPFLPNASQRWKAINITHGFKTPGSTIPTLDGSFFSHDLFTYTFFRSPVKCFWNTKPRAFKRLDLPHVSHPPSLRRIDFE